MRYNFAVLCNNDADVNEALTIFEEYYECDVTIGIPKHIREDSENMIIFDANGILTYCYGYGIAGGCNGCTGNCEKEYDFLSVSEFASMYNYDAEVTEEDISVIDMIASSLC